MTNDHTAARPGLSTRILLGFGVGTAAGLGAHALGEGGVLPAWADWAVRNVTEPAGKLFLRLLLMTVVPLVVTSLTLGIAGLGDLRRLGRIGLRTLGYTALVTGISVAIGLTLANTIQPGLRVDARLRETLFRPTAGLEAATGSLGGGRPFAQAVVDLVPENPFASAARTPPDLLALMVFSVFLGVSLAASREAGRPLAQVLESVFAVLQKVVALVLELAPFGVAALLATMTARSGLSLLQGLAAFVLTVLAGLAFHQFVVYSLLLKFVARVSPLQFFRRARTVMATAFATSSSAATLPTALREAQERLGLPREIASFVLTLGATANQHGTAIYEGVTVLFLAQLFGVDLSLSQQLAVLGMAVVAGVGTAGVPSGSLPFIALVLQSVGVPPDGIAVILGVDRLLDMCRTVPNVTGDLVLATMVARAEGVAVFEEPAPETEAQ